MKGCYDKAGHDLSDIYRGRLDMLKGLIELKEAVLKAKKEEEEKIKKGANGNEMGRQNNEG